MHLALGHTHQYKCKQVVLDKNYKKNNNQKNTTLIMYMTLYLCLQLLKPAILLALEEKLGQYFTSEVGMAWERVFNYIGSKIMKGISSLKQSH